jgi:hypothetical protein
MTRERDDLHPALVHLIEQLPPGTYEITESGVMVEWSSVFRDTPDPESAAFSDEVVELLEFLDRLAAYITAPASQGLINAVWLVQHGWAVSVAAEAFGLPECVLQEAVDAFKEDQG